MMTSQKLLVRPQQHAHERYEDYIVRIAKLNGFASERHLINHLKSWSTENELNIFGKFRLERISQILGQYLNRIFTLNSFDYPGFGKRYKFSKVCRSCVSQSDVMKFYWYLDDYHICHIHKELLIPVGVNCSQMLADTVNNIRHPIVDFLECGDPWLAITTVKKNIKELDWVCSEMQIFFAMNHGLNITVNEAKQWIADYGMSNSSPSSKFDHVIDLISNVSHISFEHTRLIAALLLWQRMLPNYTLRLAGKYAASATEASLEWATHQLVGSESMLMFLYDAHGAPRNSPKMRLKNYIPYFVSLTEEADKHFCKTIYSCVLGDDLLAIFHQKSSTIDLIKVETIHMEAVPEDV